jgi:hypothetical protein
MMARFGPLKEPEFQRFVLGDDCWVLGCPPAKAWPVPQESPTRLELVFE